MATTTTNLGLTKPIGTEKALVSVINGNMDIIDNKVGAIPQNESVQSQITALNNQIAPQTIEQSTLSGLNSAIISANNALSNGEKKAVYVKGVADAGMVAGSFYMGWVMRNSNNYGVCQLYHHSGQQITGAINNGTITWDSITNKIANMETEVLLSEFTGTVATSVDLAQIATNFRLLVIAVYNTAGDMFGCATVTPFYAKNVPIKLYGESSSQWGSATLSNDYLSATFNRTTSNTSKVRLIGILKK